MRALAATALLLVAGCEVTAPDRRDHYGFALQPENLVFSWPADRLPVKYFVQSIGALPDYARSGLTAWEGQFLYGEFEGELSSDSAGADVMILLEGGTPAAATLTADPPVIACDGGTSALLTSSSELARPVVIKVRWFPGFTPTETANCISRVTAHEIGHSIGIFQHSNSPADMMFGVPSVRAPSTRDRATAEVLYHTKPTLAPVARP